METVSGTRLTAYGTCTKQHDYMYGLKITPRATNLAKYRGVMGHEALAAYYLAMQNGLPLDSCLAEAKLVLQKETMRIATEEPEEFDKVQTLLEIKGRLKTYRDHYDTEPFKVLAVEQDYRVPFSDSVEYEMILDLLVEMTAGPYKGSIVIFDHKWVYNFKSIRELQLDAQLPKYIMTLRKQGIYVTRGVFNQIRYREIKDPLPNKIFQRTPLESKKKEWESVWNEQRDMALEIIDDPRPVRRSYNGYVCKGCDYADLCMLERSGADTTLMIQTQFMKRERPLKDIGNDAA